MNSGTLGTVYSPRMRRADIEVPNHAVAVSARARSACYPRGSLYPMNPGVPTHNQRVTWLDFRPCSTCVSRSQAHCIPIPLAPKLPPTLCIHTRSAASGCSKAPRGLSVLLRIARIFTGATISPSFSLRQFPSRYAFHAGRYLADKEFRYLRTVRVTAAIHQGFTSMLHLR